jgi:rhodanese-related sulfurtransferase
MPRELHPQELAAWMKEGKPLLLVDVREPWEREIAKLAPDVHVPLDQLPARATEIAPPPGTSVVFYCHAGMRSWMAAEYVESRGQPESFSLAGGIDAWSWLVDPQLARY